jgi:hypothetical protein
MPLEQKNNLIRPRTASCWRQKCGMQKAKVPDLRSFSGDVSELQQRLTHLKYYRMKELLCAACV